MRAWLTMLALLVVLAGLPLGSPSPALAHDGVDSFLYELVENLDLPYLLATGIRVSHWTAQGTARAGSPFCPTEAVNRLAQKAKACVVTAFGMDSIDTNPSRLDGTVWANVAAVVNCDNSVDAAECVVMTGQIEGVVSLVPFNGPPVVPDLGKRWQLLGPTVPLIYVVGSFTPDDEVVLRTSPPETAPPVGTFKFRATFRLPFQISRVGQPVLPEPDRAFYLADDGSLIKLRRDESALGEPVLRAEVTFDRPPKEEHRGGGHGHR